MVILKLKTLGYIPNPDKHTVRYKENLIRFLSGDGRGEDQRTDFAVNEGTCKWVIAPTFEIAIELMRSQVADYVSKVGWLFADLNDIYFTESHSDVELNFNLCDSKSEAVDRGYFWTPCGTHCDKHRLSDGQII